MQDQVIAKKMCNFLIENAQGNFSLVSDIADAAGFEFDSESTELVIKQFHKAFGGLWVGGNACLTPNELSFKPNLLNDIAHKGDNSLSIPLRSILNVEVTFGFVTKIIQLRTKTSTLKLRCWGAAGFAEQIKNAISKLKA
jgi:hypothetical protein